MGLLFIHFGQPTFQFEEGLKEGINTIGLSQITIRLIALELWQLRQQGVACRMSGSRRWVGGSWQHSRYISVHSI